MQKPQEIIASRQNALIVRLCKLADRKQRVREGAFRFDGKKLFLEALCKGLPLEAVLLRASNADGIVAAADAFSLPAGCRAVLLPDALFDRISEENAPDGVICICRRLDKIHKIVTINKGDAFSAPVTGRTLFLESIRDPGNLGTVIRSARAFGVDTLVMSADCADIYHPRTLRAAMGTLFSQRVLIVDDLAGAVRAYRAAGGRVLAATLRPDALRLGEFSPKAGDAALVGNEGHGLTDALIAAASECVFIPMESGVESLNAGIAASVLLWEFYRGR